MKFSFYRVADGIFTGSGVQIEPYSQQRLEACTPSGCAAIEGDHNPRLVRYDAATASVVAWQPPAPPADPNRTWQWSAPAHEWLPVPTIDARRANKWTQIKAERDAREFGPLTWDGSTLDADATSQTRLAATHRRSLVPQLLGAPLFGVVWTLRNNTTRTLSASQVAAIVAALADRVDAVHATGRSLRAQIDAATTQAQLDAITWPG